MVDIAKWNWVNIANVAKVNGIATSSIAKINWLTVPSASNWLLNSLEHLWELDSNANDAHWSLNGTANSITWDTTNQKLGSACADLDRTNPSSIDITWLDISWWDATFAFWARNDNTTDNHYIFDCVSPSRIVLVLYHSSTSNGIWFFDWAFKSFWVAPSGNLDHYVFAFDSTAGDCELWVNGVSQWTATYTAPSGFWWLTWASYIGSQNWGSVRWFTWLIDQWGIRSRVFAQSDVDSLYNSGSWLLYSSFTS